MIEEEKQHEASRRRIERKKAKQQNIKRPETRKAHSSSDREAVKDPRYIANIEEKTKKH